MAFAHSHLSDRRGQNPNGEPRWDLSFARHFVGIFAVTFSGAVLFGIAHFAFGI